MVSRRASNSEFKFQTATPSHSRARRRVGAYVRLQLEHEGCRSAEGACVVSVAAGCWFAVSAEVTATHLARHRGDFLSGTCFGERRWSIKRHDPGKQSRALDRRVQPLKAEPRARPDGYAAPPGASLRGRRKRCISRFGALRSGQAFALSDFGSPLEALPHWTGPARISEVLGTWIGIKKFNVDERKLQKTTPSPEVPRRHRRASSPHACGQR